jgi:hypothetical protein
VSAVVLDTDHLSVVLQQRQPAYDRLVARLDQIPADDVATTIVCFQEQMQGVARLSAAGTRRRPYPARVR